MTQPDPSRIGVVGAGTMGSGIALTALYAGLEVALTDVSPEALGRGSKYIEEHLKRKNLADRFQQLTLTEDLSALKGIHVVIEAALEDLELKKTLFTELDRICPPPALLATNTSTLSVTAVASATSTPERVAGMHFFNPAPVMSLVEVVPGVSTTQETIHALTRLAETLGKSPVVARDTPGFIVNRVMRPFYGEALRLLGERIASHEEIDRLLSLGGGFRMGPFELMDLIGLDVNLAASSSMYDSTYGEPRYRPHGLQRQLVESGWLGRKTGRGFYEYDGDEISSVSPELPETSQRSGYIIVSDGSWAPDLGRLLVQTGYTLSETHGDLPLAALVVNGREEGVRDVVRRYDRGLSPEIPILCQTVDIAWSEVVLGTRHPDRIIGFDGIFFASGKAVTLVGEEASDATRLTTQRLIESLGRLPIWVSESPAMVVPRVVCCLANEAAFAVGEGVAERDEIDRAMELGVNYPKGPLRWAEEMGYERVLAILEHLWTEYREERYRPAGVLRRWARQSVD